MSPKAEDEQTMDMTKMTPTDQVMIQTGWQTLDRLAKWPTVGATYSVVRKTYRDVKGSHDVISLWCSAIEKTVGLGNLWARWFLPPLWVGDKVASKCIQVMEDMVPIVKEKPTVVYSAVFDTATKTTETVLGYGKFLASPLKDTFIDTGVTTVVNYNLSAVNTLVDLVLSPGITEVGCRRGNFYQLNVVEKSFCVGEKVTLRMAALGVSSIRLVKAIMIGVLERVNVVTRMMCSLTGIPMILRSLRSLKARLRKEVQLLMTPGDQQGILTRAARLLVNVYVTLTRALSSVTGAARYTVLAAVKMMESTFDLLANQSGLTLGSGGSRSRSSSDDLGSDNSEEYRGPAKLPPTPNPATINTRWPPKSMPSADTEGWQDRAESDWAGGSGPKSIPIQS